MTEEERNRNSFGTSLKFSFNRGDPTFYPSSLPGFFPDLTRCQCTTEPFHLPTLDGLHLVPGLCEGVLIGVEALAGFPTLQTLRHTAQLGYHGVNVHGSESKNKSMVIHIQNTHEDTKTEKIAADMVGKRAFVNWPFLREAMVVAVSDSHFKYEKVPFGTGKELRVLGNPHTPQGLNYWKAKADKIEHYYSKRLGVITGPVEVLLHVRPLKGNYIISGSLSMLKPVDHDNSLPSVMTVSSPSLISPPSPVPSIPLSLSSIPLSLPQTRRCTSH